MNKSHEGNQPDTYETPDPIAQLSEEHSKEHENENENIDRAGVPVKSAFARFAETRGSDSASQGSRRRFLSQQKDFEIIDDHTQETPLQKFHRLQFEIKQFIQELDVVQKAQPKSLIEQDVNPLELTHQLAFLQQQLQGLLTDDHARAMLYPQHFIQHYSHLQTDLSKKLEAELTSVKTSGSAQPSGPISKAVTYELYYTPDQAKHMQASKLVDIERRVASLEALVGQPSGGTSLISTVSELRDKIILLDSGRLEGVQQRMKVILPQLEATTGRTLSDAKGSSSSATEKKINELYETINKWDLVAQQLPTLVGRLSALRALHEDGLKHSTRKIFRRLSGSAGFANHFHSFSANLHKLENEQQAVSGLLRDNATLLTKVETSFFENIETIQKNMGLLEERFKILDAETKAK